MHENQNPERPDTLDNLYQELNTAQREHNLAVAATVRTQRNLAVAKNRYKRQALWLRADELRRELEKVEAEAASITVNS